MWIVVYRACSPTDTDNFVSLSVNEALNAKTKIQPLRVVHITHVCTVVPVLELVVVVRVRYQNLLYRFYGSRTDVPVVLEWYRSTCA
jgi:hypothetical protein